MRDLDGGSGLVDLVPVAVGPLLYICDGLVDLIITGQFTLGCIGSSYRLVDLYGPVDVARGILCRLVDLKVDGCTIWAS